jgi:hypothetical protein
VRCDGLRDDLSALLVQLVKDIEDALEYLDNHFTFNKGQMDTMVQVGRAGGRGGALMWAGEGHCLLAISMCAL